jgi:hypothetical protein
MATIKEEQIRALPGWQAGGDGISRTFRFGRAGPWSPLGPLTGTRPRPVGQAGP